MKKIISLILVLVMISAMTVVTFANDFSGSYKVVGKASATESVSVGDTFTYSIFLEDTAAETLEIDCNGAVWGIQLLYDDSAFTLKSVPTVNYDFSLDTTNSKNEAGSYEAQFKHTTEGVNTFTKDTALLVFEFTVAENATAGAKTFSIDYHEILDCVDFANLTIGENAVADMAPVTVEGEDDGEDFEVTPGVTDGKTSISFFAKNPSEVELAAGNYGIYLGGQKFLGGLGSKIGGTDYPVGANGAWAITVVDDLGTVFTTDKAFNYSAFYIVDGVETIVPNSTAVWTVQ